MTTRRRLALTTLAVAAALGLCDTTFAPGAPSAAAPAFAQQVKPEDMEADWNKGWDNALANSAKKYEDLYKWCVQKKIAFTAINARRMVLRYDPDNEEVRKFVGYGKEDGKWIRNENRRDQIRQESDIEDPKAMKFSEKEASTNKSVVGFWKSLAVKARKYGEADAANAAAWAEKAARCWERVLQVDSSNEEAHKALGHPKYGGKLVRPEAVPFLKTRDERKSGGQKRANTPYKTEPTDLSGAIPTGGLTGSGAKSEHFIVNTVHGKDVAAKLCVWAERAMADFIEIYGVDPGIKDRLPWVKYNIVKDKEEFKKLLAGTGMKAPEIERFTQFFGGGSNIPAGECSSTSSGGADSDDYMIHYTGHGLSHAMRNMAIQDVGSPNEGMEDWLQESIAYDITRRLTGTTLTTCGAFGKYGTDIDPNPAKDIWIELARRLVDWDDDVPLARLWKCKHENQDLRGPETVKGYAFLQFLFESDVDTARKFVWTASAQGTPKAVEAVYGCTLEELDARYRDWIVKSW